MNSKMAKESTARPGTLPRTTLPETFESCAQEYDLYRPTIPRALVDGIFEDLQLPPNLEILEIGCGSGQATESFLERGHSLTALEPGPRLLRLAKKKFAGRPGLKFVQSRFESFRSPNRRFDLVVASSSLHWVDPEYRYEKTDRLLKPSGFLIQLLTNCEFAPRSQRFVDEFADRFRSKMVLQAASSFRDRDVDLNARFQLQKNYSHQFSLQTDFSFLAGHLRTFFEPRLLQARDQDWYWKVLASLVAQRGPLRVQFQTFATVLTPVELSFGNRI